MAGYTITKELGVGSQGTAKLATNKTGASFCLKCYSKDQMLVGGMEELKEEFEALQLLHCERIAGAFEMFQDAQFYYLVGEAFHGGDFLTLKPRAMAQSVPMTEDWFRGVWKQCFEGIAFMHSQAFMHCDIKEPNIMIKNQDFSAPEVVIIDLGVAKAMVQLGQEGIPHGTPGYVPPETWTTKKWFPQGDIFSLGVVIWQTMCDSVPPNGPRAMETVGGLFVEGCSSIPEIYQATMNRQPNFELMPPDMPGLAELAEMCLQKNPESRPRANACLKDPWFTGEKKRDRAPRKSVAPLDHLRPRNRFCTQGITKSFLMRLEDEDDDDSDESDDERQFVYAPNVTPSGRLKTPDSTPDRERPKDEKKTQADQADAITEVRNPVQSASVPSLGGQLSSATRRVQKATTAPPPPTRLTAMRTANRMARMAREGEVVSEYRRLSVNRVRKVQRQSSYPELPRHHFRSIPPSSPALVNRIFGDPAATPRMSRGSAPAAIDLKAILTTHVKEELTKAGRRFSDDMERACDRVYGAALKTGSSDLKGSNQELHPGTQELFSRLFPNGEEAMTPQGSYQGPAGIRESVSNDLLNGVFGPQQWCAKQSKAYGPQVV
jgi:serine/threonine protein kinase